MKQPAAGLLSQLLAYHFFNFVLISVTKKLESSCEEPSTGTGCSKVDPQILRIPRAPGSPDPRDPQDPGSGTVNSVGGSRAWTRVRYGCWRGDGRCVRRNGKYRGRSRARRGMPAPRARGLLGAETGTREVREVEGAPFRGAEAENLVEL